MSTAANLSAMQNLYRRKVTVACGSCRKRRVKCSGTQPCTLCCESGRQCEFDPNSRSRRGPKPRQPASHQQTQRTVRPLAPRPPSSNNDAMRPGGIGSGDEPPWPSQGMQVAEELETRIVDDDSDAESSDDWDHDSDSSPDEYPLHDPLQWMPALENLLYRDDSIANVLPGLDVHLVCHLLEIFTSLSSAQLRLLLSPPQIESQLSSGTMSRCLVLAACASAVRFSLHKAVARPDAKQFAEGIAREARKCIHISSDPNIQVNSIKSICILVDYSASKAHGRQAWADIAMGQALIDLARSECEMDLELGDALNSAQRYLAQAQLTHCLGHPSLYPPHRQPERTLKPDIPGTSIKLGHPGLVNLLEILMCVYQLQSVPVKEQQPPPWALNSKFRSLQNQLEEHLLHYPEISRLFSKAPSSHTLRGNDIEGLISSLIWHCCVVVLNRTFLPIPLKISTGSGPEQTVNNIDFPGAPYLFVKEKAYRCESSADAVFGICRDIVRAKAFHSYATLVGFACTQSALVIMNQLHRSSKPYEPRIVGNLKTSLIILGALKTFYTPAERWINILIQAHSSTISSSDHIDSAFNGFFNRFVGMHEPAFVPLDPGEKDAAKGSRATHEPMQTKERYGEQTSKIIGRAANRASDNGSEWLQAYAGHLSADIGPENAPNQLDASTNPTAIHDKQMDSGTTTETLPLPSANGEQVPDILSTEPEVVELPDHMGAAILTAMSGNIRSSTPNLRDADAEQPEPAVVQHLAQENADNTFQTDFEPVSSFSELVGFNLELGVFPGLDLVVDGPEMFGVFNYDDTLGPTLSPSAFYM